MKTVRITYNEDEKSKKWMNKNLNPQEQSGFIREATAKAIFNRRKAEAAVKA